VLSWLGRVWGSLWGGVSSAVSAAVHFVIGGIAGLLDTIFGDVGDAWDDLVSTTAKLAGGAEAIGKSVWNQVDKILTHYIPFYAMTAWWWVTNLESLAQVLLWHLLKWLETWAWTAAQYLGEFTLALVVRNLRRLMILVETIVSAVL
jgi:hypothetical protein